MDKTKIDDFLIEAIKPEVEKIQQKIRDKNGLSHQDINTLLLKSQYNHINHLDKRLDDIVEDNHNLRKDFAGLETKFAGLETKFAGLETKFEIAQVKMQEIIISTMRWYIGGAGVILIILKALDLFIK